MARKTAKKARTRRTAEITALIQSKSASAPFAQAVTTNGICRRSEIPRNGIAAREASSTKEPTSAPEEDRSAASSILPSGARMETACRNNGVAMATTTAATDPMKPTAAFIVTKTNSSARKRTNASLRRRCATVRSIVVTAEVTRWAAPPEMAAGADRSSSRAETRDASLQAPFAMAKTTAATPPTRTIAHGSSLIVMIDQLRKRFRFDKDDLTGYLKSRAMISMEEHVHERRRTLS